MSTHPTRLLALLLLGLACLSSCRGGSSGENPRPQIPNRVPVMITVQNDTGYDLIDLQVGGERFGILPIDKRSDTRLFPYAYSYNYVSALVDGEPLIIQPIDYVGETPLPAGEYTYVLGLENYAPGQRRLTIVALAN